MDGRGKSYTFVAALADTNILVYKFDARWPEKQRAATALLRTGAENDSIRISHQGILEFVSAVTRGIATSLLAPDEARREAEEFLAEFQVLYPNEQVVRLALRGAAAYRLSWFDAHMWAYAEHFGLSEIYSEDFQHGRLYGSVRAINPFL